MAEIPNGDYIHRSIDQLRNERGVHEYNKHFTDLRNNIVADYAIKVGLNNNNSLIDNRNTPTTISNQSTNHLEQKHQYSTSNTSLDAQMNEGKIFTSSVKSEQHQSSQMRETKPYKCTQCTKTFANSSYLSQHTRIHLGIKPYRCEICQRKFTQLSHLQQHIRTHTGDKPYKCRTPGCVKAFSQLSNLQSHSRCHATDKPYKCNACYKCFVDENALLDHIPKHKESKHLKTHICQYCGKSYTQETYLAKHLQKHIEKAEKRGTNLASLGLAAAAVARNNNISNNNGHSLEHSSYWPKISPDSAASSLAENVQHQQQQQQQQQYDFVLNQQQNHSANESLQGHRTILEHHQQQQQRNSGNNNNSNGNGSDDVGEDLVVIRQNPTQHLIVTAASNNQQTSSIVVTSSPYDTVSKSNSAFTPINVMPSHLNTLQHHQLTQRPLYYDATIFQNKNIPQNASNSFPNQLISLHQIRNYAHQPGLAGEHLIGIGITSKDKGQ